MKKGKFIVLIVAGLIVSRIPTFFQPFIDIDEALFALFARIWEHGGIPYVNVVETKALGIYIYYMVASWLVGTFNDVTMVGVHLLTLVWTGLTAWVIGRIANRCARAAALPARAGVWAALLFVLMSASYVPKIVAASQMAVLLLPVCLAMDLLLRPAEDITPWMSFLAGVFVAAATLVKYQAGILIVVILAYFWLLRFSWRPALHHSLFFILGGLPLPALMLGYLHHAGALSDFWYWNFGGSLRYIQGGSSSIDLWGKVKTHVLTYLACTSPIWVLSTLRLKKFRDDAALWLWLVFSIIPVVLGKRFYGHYFLILLPPLCILSALQIVSWDSVTWLRRRNILVGILATFFVITSVPRFWPRPFYAPLHEEVISDSKPYGNYLKARTAPSDRIFVWGFSPAVYWYADRLPATRFLWSDVLVGRLPGLQQARERGVDFTQRERPELWKMFYDDLAAHPPAYIMDMAPTGMHNYQNFPMSKYPHLMAYLAAHYVQEPDFNGAKVFKLRRPSSQFSIR